MTFGRLRPALELSVSVFAAASAIVPLHPMNASVTPSAIFSFRKVNSSYSGPCLKLCNGTNAMTRDVPFDANGIADLTDPATVAWVNANAGGVYYLHTPYDQSGNNRHFAPFNYIGAITVQGFQDRAGRWIPTIDNPNTTSTGAWGTQGGNIFNYGGTANLAMFFVHAPQGWARSSGNFSRTYPQKFGDTDAIAAAGLIQIGGAIIAQSTGGYHAETTLYAKYGQLSVEQRCGLDGIGYGVSNAARSIAGGSTFRNIWWNQTGAYVSGGGDTRILFQNRPHGQAAGTAGPIIIGAGSTANTKISEIIVFHAASGAWLSDSECQRIAIWQRLQLGELQAVRYPTRYGIGLSGESLSAWIPSDSLSSSTGAAGSNAWDRILLPRLKSLISYAAASHNLEIFGAAYTGSTLMKGATAPSIPTGPGGTSWNASDGSDAQNFWWDQDNGIAGPRAQSWALAAINNGFLPAGPYATKYFDALVQHWNQGVNDADRFLSGTPSAPYASATFANYQISLHALFDWMQLQVDGVAHPFGAGGKIKFIVRGLGARGPGSSNGGAMRTLRLIQDTVAAGRSDMIVGPEGGNLNWYDGTHYARGPADPKGFDLDCEYMARSFAFYCGFTGVACTPPEIAGATAVNSTTIDVTITHASGNDITPTSGIAGFEISDSGGAKTITAAVRQSPNTIRLTVSTPLGLSRMLDYNPNRDAASGSVNSPKVFDNFPLPGQTVGFPLRSAHNVPVM